MMDNQHRKISGYRELSQEEIDLMNEGKALAEKVGDYVERLNAHPDIDAQCVAIGKTNLQQGFMWVIRGIARPTTTF